MNPDCARWYSHCFKLQAKVNSIRSLAERLGEDPAAGSHGVGLLTRRERPAGWDSGQERAMVPFCL